MRNRFLPIIEADQLERKMLEAAEAIRKNAERGKTVKLHIARVVKERSKAIELPSSFEDEDEEEGEDELS